jgi:Multicopper oxidase
VYPQSWTAIYMALDNVGMWNIRSENWARQYLGQQFYLRVYSPANSWRDENPIPRNALLCGRASGRRTRPLWVLTLIGLRFSVTKGWQFKRLILSWNADRLYSLLSRFYLFLTNLLSSYRIYMCHSSHRPIVPSN